MDNDSYKRFGQWAAQNNSRTVEGDFNGDGVTDFMLFGIGNLDHAPVAFSSGFGTLHTYNPACGDFQMYTADCRSTIIVGHFNYDGREDAAVLGVPYQKTMPVLLSGEVSHKYEATYERKSVNLGDFTQWATTSNVQILNGDFNGDGLMDIALVGGYGWKTIPVAFSNGDGTFTVTNSPSPDFARCATFPGVQVIVGNFDGGQRQDICLIGAERQSSIPVALSNGDGTFRIQNTAHAALQYWTSSPQTMLLVGDYDGDSYTDIALTGHSAFSSFPVAYSDGNGGFFPYNHSLTNPDFAKVGTTDLNIKIIPGDFDFDGMTDVALVGGSIAGTIPVAYSQRRYYSLEVMQSSVASFPEEATKITPRQ
jgi:hypothetical protein